MTAPATTPKKDVIYVDIEDDITSIIDKVKHSDAPIVALVPPKRIGVLQSVVNLKLLQRAAESTKKRVVLITSDHALSTLAAGAAIPVARNLQSKPELAVAVPDVPEDDEIIDGDTVPEASAEVDDVIEGEPAAEAVAPTLAQSKRRESTGPSIPNFDTFRNRLALIVAGTLALIVFLVWAFIFAPHATVTIAAKTTPYSVNKQITAKPGANLSAADGLLTTEVKEISKTASVDFQATGKKDVGEKASGTVKFTNSDPDAITIDAGDAMRTSGGLSFVANAAITIPGATLGWNCPNLRCVGTASGTVTAAESGTKYNAASGSVSGVPDGVTAAFASPTGGGTDKTITVVSEQDAAAAKEKLASQDANAIKDELKKQFGADSIVVNESFMATPGNPNVAPAIGEEATTAKISIETKYTMIGLKKTDIASILESDLKKQLAGIPNQTIYDKGVDAVRFATVSKDGDAYKLNLQATGYVGPSIDTAKLATQLSGKREGEIIALVKTYDGISDVKVAFSPFWVSSAPSADKITIKFQVNNANN